MEFATWKTLLKSNDPLERSEASDLLPKADPEEIIPFLIDALEDDYDVVQMNVLDSLGFYPCEPVRKAIRNFLLKELDELVRGYALEALGRVGEVEDFLVLLRLLNENPSPRIQINIISGLYQGIQYLSMHKIEELIQNEDFLIRRTTTNILLELLYSWTRNLKTTKKTFESQLSNETTPGDRESLEKALKWVNDYLKVSKKYTD